MERQNKTISPVIGIIAIPLTSSGITEIDHKEGSTFIHAQYVKFVESLGALAVPIQHDIDLEEMNELIFKINGVIFPGGLISFVKNAEGELSKYGKLIKFIMDKAIEFNESGNTFPLLGIWNGFQAMMTVANGGFPWIDWTDAKGIADSLELNFDNPKDTQLFSEFPDDVLEAIQVEKASYNGHRFGIRTKSYKSGEHKYSSFFNALWFTDDRKGISYVSIAEAKDYPFFITQFHPELCAFWFKVDRIPHSEAALDLSYYISEKFIEEARKGKNRFPTYEELINNLIIKTGKHYIGEFESNIHQIYIYRIE